MDRLAEEVWAGRPPEGWATTLQTYVFHLRRALEPDRPRGQQKVLARGVDGGSLPRPGLSVAHQARQDDDRDALEVLDEVVHRPGHPRLRRICQLPGARVVAVTDPLLRPQPTSFVADQLLGGPGSLAFSQHQEPARLAVRPGGRTGGGEQHRRQLLVGDRVRSQTADGPRRGDDVEKVPGRGWGHSQGSPFVSSSPKMPPSTLITAPVVKLDASLAR